MSKDTVKLFQRARAALQSEKDSLSKALANAQATAADAEKRLAEIEAALGSAGTATAKRRGPAKKKKAAKASGKSPIGTIFVKIMMITAVSLGLAFVMTFLFTEGYFG